MKILIKMPTRDRQKQFFKLLNICIEKLSDRNEIHFLISCDFDDKSMNNRTIKNRLDLYENLSYYFADRDSKIAACNRDMDKVKIWDIVVLMSDDMMPIVDNYDLYISRAMEKYFPDTDGVLWFFDGFRDDIITLSIMGKKYYDRFNYIYYPEYKSFFCDNEFTAVAEKLSKVQKCDFLMTLIEHQHYSLSKKFRGLPLAVKKSSPLTYADKLYAENRVGLSDDQKLFVRRTRENYGL